MNAIERWRCYEWTLEADIAGIANPFTDVSLKATVQGPDGTCKFDGFYDGGNTFKIRYMPQLEGEYTLTASSSLKALDGLSTTFRAAPPRPGNHGPVVPDGTHFRYADGTPFFVMGTTAYVWHHRPQEIRRQTLRAFSEYGFNKIRMLFFPKHYTGGYGAIDVSYEPPCYPFEGQPRAFDFRRPNPAYFREFEDRLNELMERDIIADVILFHPYDFGHWDIDCGMDSDDELIYLRYIIARLASFRNVWWSLANEYDIKMDPDKKSMVVARDARDWDVIGEFIKSRDPSGHPISCHNIAFGFIYPDRPWMSHVSYQHPDTYTLMMKLRDTYKKPVINDEYQYEGNTPDDWGNSSGAIALERHWKSALAGGYATHGEAFIRENNRDIFWAYGGDMIGESPKRLRFLKQIMQTVPYERMEWDHVNGDSHHYFARKLDDREYLIFMRDDIPGKSLWVGDWESPDRAGMRYKITIYDVWNCEKVKEEVLPLTIKLPFTAWTVIHIVRVQ